MKEIPLSGQKGEGKFALVDDADFAAASAYSWDLHYRGYAYTKKLLLHHLILGNPPVGLAVDHIDGNPLNNQKANLRFATAAQNARNTASHKDSTSQFKGVSWNSKRKLWVAQIQFGETSLNLGFFTSEFDAARAYDTAAKLHHGDRAFLNFPD